MTIDFDRYKLSDDEAAKDVEVIDGMAEEAFQRQVEHWSRFQVADDYAMCYKDLRDAVVGVFQRAMEESGNKVTYALDLAVGLELYEQLNSAQGFGLIQANNDDVWRYLSMRVMPDLTFIRYPNRTEDVTAMQAFLPGLAYSGGTTPEKGSRRIKCKRFYHHPRRIWLKTLWWYIHLGWQGERQRTYEVLKGNGTNIIGHFIERIGSRGYRLGLCRSLMRAYAQLPEKNDALFRRAAKLNLARCVAVEPALTPGGEQAYAARLFEEVCTRKREGEHAEAGDIE